MRVLIVEDEIRLATSVERGLEADGIYADVAHDGSDGLWRARESKYDAIVLDIMLPEMNGYEMCRTLRSEEIWTPILFLTAKEGEFDEVEGLELGGDDYLRKPFSHAVLSARLRALVRRGKSPRPTCLDVGDLNLDPGTRRCTRRGEPVALTPREFSVLEFLMRRSPEVLTKNEILLSVWGMDFEGDPNIVEVYIGYLRRKIDRPFDVNSVRTVRGVGYQVVA